VAVVETRVEMLVDSRKLQWARPQVRRSLQPVVEALRCGPCLVVEPVDIERMEKVKMERSGEVYLGRSCRVVCRLRNLDLCPLQCPQREQQSFPSSEASERTSERPS